MTFQYPAGQRGVVTLTVGVLLLLLITVVTLYGARVGLLEQRISANEYRAKLAHGAAEAGRNNAIEFLNANLPVFNTDEDYFRSDGTTVAGWLASGNDRWGDVVTLDCSSPANDHERAACDAGMRGDIYFYDATPDNDATDDTDLDVFDTNDFAADRLGNLNQGRTGDEVRVSYNADMILCPLNTVPTDHDGDASTPDVPRIPPAPADTCVDDIEDTQYFGVLIRSEGFIIGDADGDGTLERLDDEAVAQSSEVVIKYDVFGAGPRVPLTVANTFGAGGTFDIVANPNGGPNTAGGGKSGAPFSVWSPDPYTVGGSTVTCQLYEFYQTGNDEPFSVDPPNDRYRVCYDCECPSKQNPFYYLSSDEIPADQRFDIVDEDPDFPADLFQYTFGIAREDYTILKELATKIPGADYADCGSLDQDSSGLFWSEGTCTFNSNQIAGSPHNPVLVISEGDVTMNGGAVIFGVVYVFSAPDTGGSPNLSMNGGSQIYGAVVGDSDGSGAGTGNNVIVYDQEVLDRLSLAPELQRVSPLPGTWTDRAP